MTANRFTSVWDAIENTPQEAASMKARSSLMMELTAVIQERGMTQAEAAELFGALRRQARDLETLRDQRFDQGFDLAEAGARCGDDVDPFAVHADIDGDQEAFHRPEVMRDQTA